MAGVVAAALAGGGVACSSGADAGEGRRRNGNSDEGASDLPPVPDGLPDDVFALGVASGDPLPGSVILWTRLVADPGAPDGGIGADPVPVGWEVSADEGFEDVVARGDHVARPALGHSVHVDATGLEPDTWYWYRFTVGDRRSPAGRTRTTPAEGTQPSSLRFAFASCQNRQHGYWHAHTHLAEEDDLDLVLFLGDYIYESGRQDASVQPHESPRPVDLATYRRRWAEYKADPALQAAHARCPWVCTWDDHEVSNDYADEVAGDAHPDDQLARAEFVARRVAAYQAYYEHLPLRVEPPDGPDLHIYRQVAWGDLARFFVLDGRQYRSDQACLPVPPGAAPQCVDRGSDERTMLGEEQEDWLGGALSGTTAAWNVIAQQTVVSALPLAEAFFNLDQWDGYPAARRRLADQLGEVRNPVIVTGDIHMNAVGTLTSDPDDPATPALATELVGTSLSTTFTLPELVERLADALPNVHYADGSRRGYVVCTVSAGELRAEFRTVSTVDQPDADVETAATWLIRDGDPTPVPA